ncbi:hypothetical protein [Tardisphaera saccharovorans]
MVYGRPVMLDLSSGSSDLLSYMILMFAIGTCASLTALALTGDLFKMRDFLVDRRIVIYRVAGLLITASPPF